MIDKNYISQAFNNYVADYDPEDPKIRLKIRHTYRVAGLCARIAEETGAADVPLAWACGMLHDIGRFEQVRRYGTFIDADSVPHAALGIELLFREGLLRQIAPDLSEAQSHLLHVAVEHHSAYRLPPDLTPEEQQYCDILRDADKIDIFRAIADADLTEVLNVERKELEEAAVSEEVKDCFRNGSTVLRKLKKTPADYLVAYICMSGELVYPVSRQIAREQGDLDRLLAFQSRNPETAEWFEYMRESVTSNL